MGAVTLTRVDVGPVQVELHGYDRICRRLAEGDTFEPRSLRRWSRMVEPGRTALDVGAYTGLFSISAAKLGAWVVAMEPIARVARRLRLNAEANGVALKVVEAGASDISGRRSIAHNLAVDMSAGASFERKSGPREYVACVRVDDLALSDLAAVKIDVERHEEAVLRGARDTLERWRPRMLIEVLDRERESAVVGLLPRGYRVIEPLDGRNLYLEHRG